MSDNQSKRKRQCCNKLRNRHNCKIGDLWIIRRRFFRSKPKEPDCDIHIYIQIGNIGTLKNRILFSFLGGFVFVFVFVLFLAGRDVEDLAIYLAIITVVVSISVNILVIPLANSRSQYGELLLSLSQVRTVSGRDRRKQCLIDAALKLYALEGCRREGFLQFLEWINHKKRTSVEFIELADSLTTLLCKDISWHIIRRIGHLIVWIWTEPPRLSWKLDS